MQVVRKRKAPATRHELRSPKQTKMDEGNAVEGLLSLSQAEQTNVAGLIPDECVPSTSHAIFINLGVNYDY